MSEVYQPGARDARARRLTEPYETDLGTIYTDAALCGTHELSLAAVGSARFIHLRVWHN